MASARTIYREKRIKLICDAIRRLALLLQLEKQQLENIHLKEYKEIHRIIDRMEQGAKE